MSDYDIKNQLAILTILVLLLGLGLFVISKVDRSEIRNLQRRIAVLEQEQVNR